MGTTICRMGAPGGPMHRSLPADGWSSHHDRPQFSRSFGWFVALVLLTLAGDAALGDQRPAFERQWKAAAAILLGLAATVVLWKRHRWRRRATTEPAVRHEWPTPTVALAHAACRSDPAVPVRMPELGERAEGTVTRWLKQLGDPVTAGEPLFEVSTDKVDAEIPAEASGTLLEIKVAAGTTAPVGAAIATIKPDAGMPSGSQTE